MNFYILQKKLGPYILIESLGPRQMLFLIRLNPCTLCFWLFWYWAAKFVGSQVQNPDEFYYILSGKSTWLSHHWSLGFKKMTLSEV